MSDDLVVAYRRDAAWRNSIGFAIKYHMPHRDDAARSACGSYVLHDQLFSLVSSLGATARCGRSGCRQQFARADEVQPR